MHKALKIISIVGIIIGGLAIASAGATAVDDVSGAIYALIGGALYLAYGIVGVIAAARLKKLEEWLTTKN